MPIVTSANYEPAWESATFEKTTFLRKCGRFTITDQTKSRWLIFQQLKIDYKEKST